MKKLTIYILGLVCLSSFAANAHGQTEQKFGHINTNLVIFIMPQRKAALKILEEYTKTLEEQLTEMTEERLTKVEEYQAQEKEWLEEIREAKAEEIRQMENRIRQFQRTAQEAVQKKEADSMQPIAQSVHAAIREVANREGYTYVFDTGVGAILVAPESDDLLPLVKEELGLNDELLQEPSKAADSEDDAAESEEN